MLSHFSGIFAGGKVPIPSGSNNVPVTVDAGGNAGNKIGDILVGAIVVITDATHCKVTLRDGQAGTPMVIVDENTPVGSRSLDLFGMRSISQGGWYCTTEAGVSVILVGRIN